ncbi:GNAT family N-acetyltransferase [Paenibacillus senegalensis]|uniref:GNAT family N-acetyltransferase n=1 Tax=Paenibacillus senegalensis TaxID=1465766 RepID=UPI0002899A15|nr:GNAT family protein [Paenibacillus senegalensis]
MYCHPLNPELKLVLLQPGHKEELFKLTNQNRDYLSQWLPWVKNHNEEATRLFIETSGRQFAGNLGFQSGIFYKGKLAGCIGLHNIDWKNRKSSIGYWIGEQYQGLGLVTRSCQALLDFVFGELGLNRMEIRAGVHNEKSRSVAQRLGFQWEGTIRQAEWINEQFIDHAVYGMLADEWFEHNPHRPNQARRKDEPRMQSMFFQEGHSHSGNVNPGTK